MTAEDREGLDELRELVSDRARLELFAEHMVAELLRASSEHGSAYLSKEEVGALVRLGKSALRIEDVAWPRPVVVAPFASVLAAMWPSAEGF